MYSFYIYYLIISSFTNLFNFKRYLHYQLNGTLDNEHGMNFTIFITNFTGVVIYCLDKNNKFIIELENGERYRKIDFKFKEFYVNMESEKLCGCKKCEGIIMIITMKLKHSEVHVNCNNKKHLISISGNIKWPDQFSGYPIPMNFHEKTNETFIWMGNIGPYLGNNYVHHLPNKNQLMGCIKSLYFENKLVDNSKNECKSFTDIKGNQICSFLNLESLTKFENTFENKIQLYPPQTHIYNTNDIAKFGFPIKIDWKLYFKNGNQNFSLIRILFNEKSTISFQIDSNFKITLIMEKYGLIYCSKEFNMIGENQAKSIVIDLIKNQLKIYINYTERCIMMEDEIFLIPSEVYVASSEIIEGLINGTITFHYSLKYNTTPASGDSRNLSELEFYEIFIFISFGCILLICLFILIKKLTNVFECKFPKIQMESNSSEKRQMHFENISLPVTGSEIYDVIT